MYFKVNRTVVINFATSVNTGQFFSLNRNAATARAKFIHNKFTICIFARSYALLFAIEFIIFCVKLLYIR